MIASAEQEWWAPLMLFLVTVAYHSRRFNDASYDIVMVSLQFSGEATLI